MLSSSLKREEKKATVSPLPYSPSLQQASGKQSARMMTTVEATGDVEPLTHNRVNPPSSSSFLERANSGISLEIPPPPVLQRSAEDQILPTTSIQSAFSSGMGGAADQFSSFNNGGGATSGMINVDNIFSAILDDTPSNNNNGTMNYTTAANNPASYVSNNSIFHNFTSGGDSNNNEEGLSILIPPKKSSLHGNVITAYNPSLINTPQPPQPLQVQQQQQRHQRINSLGNSTSQQPQLSKSMNTASFLRPIISHAESNDQYDSHYHGNNNGSNGVVRRNSGHHQRPLYGGANSSITPGSRVRSGSREYNGGGTTNRRMSSGIDVPRHAGYLLKRSNNPYVDTIAGHSNVDVAVDTTASPPPVQELLLNSFDGSGIEPLYTLPFGGVDSDNALTMSPGYDYDEGSVEDEDYEEEDQCFCAPLVQLFTGRRRRKGKHLMSKKRSSDFGSPIIDSREDYQQQQQLLRDVVISQIPLKEPARSDPVPIGGEQPQQLQHYTNSAASSSTNSAAVIESGMTTNRRSMNRLMSRSYSNGSRLNDTSSTPNKSSIKLISVTPSTAPKKEYPPPPPDYIDPRDGHIWRAKYCVLEEGILYFYRNAMEGESDEAQAERNESRNFHAATTVVTTSTTTSPSLGLSSSPSVPIPIDSTFGRTGSSSTAATVDSSTRTSLSKMGKKDLFDLSKSPMPMKKSDFFHLRMPSSSMNQQPGGNAPVSAITPTPNNNTTPTPALRHSPVLLHHSNSTSTFHHDTDILWEKRVALDCVGAVRSSVQDHGDHAFELLAYGNRDDDEQSDASTRNSGEHHQQQQQHEIIDRLILRAGSSDDMNTWMFQFHRSLASYMQRIVNSALNNRHHGANVMRMRPDSPVHQLYQHRRIGTPVGSNTMNKHKQQQSSSPMGSSSFGSAYSPSTGPSLSHGHGRNALYRRKVRDDASSPTPVGSPESLIPRIERADSVDSQKKAVAVLGLRGVRKSVEGTSSSPISTTAAAAAAPKKYIPPHMRKAAPCKYVPPHLRRKKEVSKVGTDSESEIATSVVTQVPLNDSIVDDDGSKILRAKTQTREDDGAESDTPSDSALSTTSSLLSRQMDDVSDVISSSNVRRGGCADPTVILGSILDDIFIPRKASILEKARLQPYGCIGGGFFTSMRYAQVEEDSIPFDDDMNDTGNRAFLSGLKWEVGASSECGIRNSNEDSYVVINNLDEMISSQGLTSFAEQDVGQTKQQGLFAIFDGHVGNQAARFSAEKFPEMLMEEQSALASRDSAILSSIEDRTLEVLSNAFDRLDKEFCSLCTRDGREWDSGSTALAALVVDDVVTLANLGDCRGVVCRVVSSGIAETADSEWQELDPEDDEDMLWDRANGAFSSGERLYWREVTETHSPLLPEEEERINAANGWIMKETEIPTGQIHRMDFFDEDVVDIVKRCFADRIGQHRSDPARSIQIARTCGDLAVSRAIGDRDFKAAYNLPTQAVVEQRKEIAMSWDGPSVFIYPDGHSGRFKGDLVSSVPDVKFFKIGQEGVVDEFLIMACDGLWDVMDADDAVRIAKNLLFDKKLSAKDGAERLAELATHLGSSDNITVILIRFYWEEIDDKK